jgi:8-oxo-dGTP pyrophosphatase MutT (NUDIX family)
MNDDAERAKALISDLGRYADILPDEAHAARAIIDFLKAEPHPFSRSTAGAHLTGSAFILDRRAGALLLIHHRALNRWLQPGGHIDAGEDAAQAALREAAEETGLAGLRLIPWRGGQLPIDVDSHAIPANPRKGEPAHVHHDIRYLIEAESTALAPDRNETLGARWAPLAELDAIFPPRVRLKLESALR